MADKPRRGRPPSGRKEILQVGLDADDYAKIAAAAELWGVTQAEVGRALIKGEKTWHDVVKAARKVGAS